MHIHDFALLPSSIGNEDKVNNMSFLPFIDTNSRVWQTSQRAQKTSPRCKYLCK